MSDESHSAGRDRDAALEGRDDDDVTWPGDAEAHDDAATHRVRSAEDWDDEVHLPKPGVVDWEVAQHLAAIVESAEDAILTKDLDGKILTWNPAAERVYGYSAAEAVGQSVVMLIPEGEERQLADILRRVASGERVEQFETTRRRKDSTVIDISLTVSPIRALGGDVVGATTISRDITQRKRDEVHLRALALIVGALADAILSVDRDGVVLTWNAAAEVLFGFSEQEMVGGTLAPVLAGLVTPVQQDRIDRLLNGETLEISDGRMRRKDGSAITISASLAPIFDESGAVTGFAGAIRDVGEQRRIEGRLRQAQKMEAIGNLAGGIAHDFNNILTVIRGNTELLMKDYVEDGHGGSLREIDSSAALAAALTAQLLTFSRQQMVSAEPVSVNDVTAATCDLLDRVIGKDVHLNRHFDADLDVIRMDRAQLQQVVLNLCVNGRDAMPDGGVITVRTANVVLDQLHADQQIDIAPGPYVLLEITDSGVGMDLETQARAFDPFFTTKSEGTGLGLSTVFGAVRQAGGTVAIYSELGIGTSFKIYLPQASSEVVATTVTEIRLSEERSVTILLVEDYDVLRALGVRILESIGHRVLSAASGREALALFEEYPDEIDLLLTDMMMPQMSGQELAGILLKKRPELRVIFTSGYPAQTALDDHMNSKRVAFIQKPYTTPDLSRQIQSVLAAPQ